jgi:poly-gamma-glutamate synthesis protein (capsule biosynthesis protein)
MEENLTITAAGDVFMPGTVRWSNGDYVENDKKSGKNVLDKVAPYFLKSDINFCNLEAPISDKGKPIAGRSAAFRSYPGMEEILKKSGITFVSLANNHSLDYGWEALSDTMERLKSAGIGYSGAGKNLDEARKPAVVEKKSMKIALLSYTANVNTPMGFKASANRHGLNPMRISPLLPNHVNMEDIEAMQEDVAKLQKETDFLAVSCHWGISEGGTHTVTQHQEIIAHSAIDAGADMIIGHHPHALQPVEIYKEKAIIYSLANFVFGLEEDFPKENILFQCLFSKHKINEVKFLPCYMSNDNTPEIVSPEDNNGQKVINLMRKLCAKYNISLRVKQETGEVIISN